MCTLMYLKQITTKDPLYSTGSSAQCYVAVWKGAGFGGDSEPERNGLGILLNYPAIGRRQWHPTLVLLPGKSHRWRSLVGCSLWGCEELNTTEPLHFHFSLSCIGEGNGNPLQCSCLENPRDREAWWVVGSGVAQSQS